MTDSTLHDSAARSQLFELMRSDVTFERKAREALELGTQYLGVDNGHLTRIDRKTDHWEALSSTDPADGRFPPGLELDLETTYCRRTIAADSTIALHDAASQGWGDDPAFETHALSCYLGTTLFVNQQPYGTVCFVSPDPRCDEFTDDETMFAQLITRELERELERDELEARLTRQTNLATVLNRVLRHNLRNDMSIIRGYTQLMAEDIEDDSYSSTALRRIDKVIELSRKARELDQIVATEFEPVSTEITSLVEELAESTEQEYPAATFTVSYDETITVSVLPDFSRALEELLENAAKHSGNHPTIEVGIEAVPNAVEIWIGDDGPGLASHEADVLETGTETPLTHGTGLGLWLAHWIVTSHDGTIDATVAEEGTTMTVTLPRSPTTNVSEQLSKLTRARDQYQAAFEKATDAMFIINDDARILEANREASGLLGVPRQEVLGRSLLKFLPEEFDDEIAWKEFQQGERARDSVTIVRADGAKRRIEFAAALDIVPGQHFILSRNVTNT